MAAFERDPALCCGDWEAAGNRIILGDNLTVMQALLPAHAAHFRCVYIDPPYNTGQSFAHYEDALASAGWLASMRERLEVMRLLMAEDGVIFVSIGDDEAAYLKVAMDEIFGRANYCGTLVWEKKKKPSFLDRNMGSVTEYILAYARNRNMAPAFVYGETTRDKKYPLNNAGNTLNTLRFPAGRIRFKCPDGLYEPQDMSEGKIITRLLDAVEVRHGVNLNDFRLEGEWRYSQDRLDQVIEAGEPIVISRVPFRPNHIKPGGQPKKIKNLLSISHYGMSTYEDASEESRCLFGDAAAFDYPKPEKLIHTLITAVTQPGDWVLDAFAGSGTTAAAAHKSGRRWLMIERGEHARTHLAARMRRVVQGNDPGGVTGLCGWTGGGGFAFYHAARS